MMMRGKVKPSAMMRESESGEKTMDSEMAEMHAGKGKKAGKKPKGFVPFKKGGGKPY